MTLPRYATLESARSIHRPSMGLLRRPTPGGIMEGGRFSRPCGPGAHSRAIRENQFAATPPFPHFNESESPTLAHIRSGDDRGWFVSPQDRNGAPDPRGGPPTRPWAIPGRARFHRPGPVRLAGHRTPQMRRSVAGSRRFVAPTDWIVSSWLLSNRLELGVFLDYDSHRGRAFIDRELYLPKAWTEDQARCRAARVPDRGRVPDQAAAGPGHARAGSGCRGAGFLGDRR